MTATRRTPPDHGRELAELLDRIDRLREQLADEVKERKGAIAKLEKRARNLRDIIAGRTGDQLDLEERAAADVLAEVRKP